MRETYRFHFLLFLLKARVCGNARFGLSGDCHLQVIQDPLQFVQRERLGQDPIY